MRLDPTVSISCTTYNHANFIKSCLEGFLMQQTSFEFEILIHDDASTDETQDIIKAYQQKHPTIIKPIFQTENQYSKGVRGIMPRFNFPRAQGKYIALCEGDDYWTDPLKLQKQVDFLEENEEYSMCFHKVNLIYPDNSIIEDNITKVPVKYESIEDLAEKGNYIHTPSVMFTRQELILPKEMYLSPVGDFFLYMIISRNEKIGYLEEIMAVYRVGSGIWSTKSSYVRNLNTNYCFALLVKTNLFTGKVNQILINRIEIFLRRFENELKSKDLLLLSLNENLTNKILQSLLDLYESEKMKTNKSIIFQLKKCVKRVLK